MLREAGVAEVAQSLLAVGIMQLRKSEKSVIPGVQVERGTDIFHKQVWQDPASPPFQCLMRTSWQPSD
eukprot:g77754.t1